jgi:hypothetical protein
MEKLEKNNIKKQILKIYKLTLEKNFSEAKKLLNSLKKFNNKEAKEASNYIEKYIEETEKYNELKSQDKESDFNKFLNFGKLSIYYDDYYSALQYFNAGYYLTKDPLFKFYIGKCYYFLSEYHLSINALKNYSKNGYLKLEKAYYFITESYTNLLYNELENDNVNYKKVDKYKSNMQNYRRRCNKLKKIRLGKIIRNEDSYVMSEKDFINVEDETLNELIKEGDFLKIKDLIYKSSNKDRIRIIDILYKKGYFNFAEGILKEYRKEISQDCKKELFEVEKAKKLYKMKSKIGGY